MQTEVGFLGHLVGRTGLACDPENLSAVRNWHEPNRFDFIECFTTTFLHAHSWLNWVDESNDDEDEVGLKEKPKDLINFIPIYCHHWDCGLGQVQVRQA